MTWRKLNDQVFLMNKIYFKSKIIIDINQITNFFVLLQAFISRNSKIFKLNFFNLVDIFW